MQKDNMRKVTEGRIKYQTLRDGVIYEDFKSAQDRNKISSHECEYIRDIVTIER